jgi:hypothetical protein
MTTNAARPGVPLVPLCLSAGHRGGLVPSSGASLVLGGRRHAMIARGRDPVLLACVAEAMAGAIG